MTDLLDDDRPFDDPVLARVRAARPAVEPLDASERARVRAAIDTVPGVTVVRADRRWRAVAWVAAAAVLVAAVAIGLHVRRPDEATVAPVPTTPPALPATVSTPADAQLAGRNYSTSRFVVNGTARDISFAQPSLTFTATPEGLQLAAGACLHGTMRVVDGRLTGSVARTPTACGADPAQLDDALTAMLNASPSITLDGSSLVIDSGSARLDASEYEPKDAMPPGILGTVWQYSSEELPAVPQAGSPPTLTISAEGTWLFGPCTGPGGKVVGRVDGTIALRVGDFALPAGGCVMSGQDTALADEIRSIGAALDGGDAVATRVGDTLIVTTATSRLEFRLGPLKG